MKPSYLKTGLYTIATTALLFCSTQNHAQQYYKWVDANGSTHYTTPPPKGAKRLKKFQPMVEISRHKHQPQQQIRLHNSKTQNAGQQAADVAVETATRTSPPAQAPSAPSHSDR